MRKNKKSKKKLRLKKEIKRKIIHGLLKTIIVFTAGVCYGRYVLNYSDMCQEEKVEDEVENKIVEVSNKVVEEQKEVCEFNDDVACKIKEHALKIGMSEDQALISIAISRWETARWTSSLFQDKNNIGGMYCNGSFIKYNTLDDGINAFVSNLKNNYFDIGLDTVEKIKNKYCPDNADNDPNGLNKNWTNGVYTMINELRGE